MSEVIDCGNEIVIGDVLSLNSKIKDTDKDLVDATKRLVCEKQKWVLRDAEILIATDDSAYTLYAGNKTNEFVVYRDESGSIKTKQKARSKVNVVDCGNEITIGDVLSLNCEINDSDKDLVDATRKLVCKTEKQVLRDAEIRIATDDSAYSLCAGDKTNEFVVYRDGSIKTEKKAINKVIDCGNEITLEDVQSLKSEICDGDKEFVDATIRLVCRAQRSVLRNAEILIATDDSAYTLYAGNKTNVFIVDRDEGGSINTETIARTEEQVVDCGTEITLGNIQMLNSKIKDADKEFVDATKKLVCEKQKWVLRDAEILIATGDAVYTLYAGNKTHAYIVYRDEGGSIKTKQTKCGWWKLMYDSGFRVKDSIPTRYASRAIRN